MNVVIQCAASKRSNAGHMRRRDGTPVMFVADQAHAPRASDLVYARPDDLGDHGRTWRAALLGYNRSPGSNHAMRSASVTRLACMCGCMLQPTTWRLNRSITAARYSQPPGFRCCRSCSWHPSGDRIHGCRASVSLGLRSVAPLTPATLAATKTDLSRGALAAPRNPDGARRSATPSWNWTWPLRAMNPRPRASPTIKRATVSWRW